MPSPILCLMGPTASGKTDLAIELAQKIPCEIISVDSAMVYRGMNIGTAKPAESILAMYPHFLINIRDPSETYSVGDFYRDAALLIPQIQARGNIPLFVGGTMMYFRALQMGLSSLPSANMVVREKLKQEALILGWPALHDRLKKKDPVTADRIRSSDTQRLQRALEIIELTGQPLSTLHQSREMQGIARDAIFIGLIPNDRKALHEKIKQRFLAMLNQGFINEVERLFQRKDLHPDLPSMRSVGYREIWKYLAGEWDFRTMQEKAIVATRQLAKRQLTWLRSWPNLISLENDSVDALIKIIV